MNTITYQWVYDGTTIIPGASGTFVVSSSTPSAVTLTSVQSAILSTLSVGSHTLRCRYTPNQSNCSGTAGVPIYSPTLSFTILDAPASITGVANTCISSYTTLSSGPPGGTWASSNAGVAMVNSSGLVTGIATGTSMITYTATSGCFTTAVATVNPAPVAITGPDQICQYSNNVYSHVVAGGVWASSDNTIASVDAGGIVTGVAPGTATITYTVPSGCFVMKSITVNAAPVAITGAMQICETATTTLFNATGGGTWSSVTPGVATIDPVTGLVTGVADGISVISYTIATGCAATYAFSVNPLPDLTVTPSTATLCIGENVVATATSPDPTFSLLSQDFNSGLSGWLVSGPAAPVNMWQIVTPLTSADGTPGDGTGMLQSAATGSITFSTVTSPSFNTMGYGSANLTFNQYLLSVSPDVSARIEFSTDGGATWTLLTEQVGSIIGASSWTAGTPTSTIALPAAALGQADVRLRWVYDASQYYWFLDNILVEAALPASTYAWTGALGLSCTTCTAPVITPTSTGDNTYSVTVTSSAGCTTTAGISVSVNPLPAAITGGLAICAGTTFTLNNSSAGGTWISSNGNVSIGSVTGAMLGIAAGTSTITYTLPTGCMITAEATISAAPAAIGGTPGVCTGQSVTLTHAVPGGVWNSSAPAVATINSFGVVDGLSAGTTMVTYTLPSGCIVWRTVTVYATPAAIAGAGVVCAGANTSLTDITPGGVWSSSTPTIATINALGTVTGVSEGFANVSYTILATGCRSVTLVTVNPLPAMTGGATEVCEGATVVVTNATVGGTWSSMFPSIAAVDAAGVVSGLSAGNTVISYVLSATGCGVASLFTVNALPATISGPAAVCKDDIAVYASAPAGGTWLSSNTAVLTIDPSGGIATAVNNGNATVTYTLPTGCQRITSVLVNPLPLAIAGVPEVCVGSTVTLYDFTPGGIWNSGDASVATIDAGGVVTGAGAGVVQITYMNAVTGCMRTKEVTVDPLPTAITGALDVCVGGTTVLGNADAGGTWVSGNNSVATIDGVTGMVTGVAAGNATISYVLPTGCLMTASVTVNALPAAISGLTSVCEGQNITWTTPSAGGVWVSDNSAIASVDAAGVITGNMAGATFITYTLPTGCMRTRGVTVNGTPSSIAGSLQACAGQTSVLNNTVGGGVWSSSNPAVAPVSSTGVVTGITAGTANITYTLPTGCKVNAAFVVDALPTVITGPLTVCEGSATTLLCATAASWSAANTTIATADATGLINGVSAGTTSIIAYTAAGCERSVVITVNALPAPLSGMLNVCAGSTTTIAGSPAGGTWSSSAAGIATVNSAGVVIGVSAGVSNITYTLPTSCSRMASVVVNPLPAAITGVTTVCVGQTTTLSNTSGGGSWSAADPSVVSIDIAGVMTGISAGTTLVTYTLPTGCQRVVPVQVNTLPSAIIGNTTICQGGTTLLGNTVAGGSWSSSDNSVAPIGVGSGAVIGAAAGFSIITYTLPTGCMATRSLVVNALPEPITGTQVVCAGSTTQLGSLTGGGTWSSSGSLAGVNATGLVTGVAAGTARITYTTGNNCKRTVIVTVNSLPGTISGADNICEGLTAVYSNANPGGVWTSDNTTVAGIDAASGVATAVSNGVATITYTLPTGCMRSKIVTVNVAVAPITGTFSVCSGLTSVLASATTDGVWISGNTTVATVGAASGVVTGISAGTVFITYASSTGCMALAAFIVNPLPIAISGADRVCEGASVTYSDVTTGGVWTSSNNTIAAVTTAGVVSGVSAGTATITYELPTGCMRTKDIEVNVLPAVYAVTGGGNYCSGGAGVVVGLDSSETGNTYTLLRGAVSFAATTGTGVPVSFGTQTVAGAYTVRAVTGYGCVRDMAGSAVVVIDPLVMPSVTLSSSAADTICAGTVVTYTATGTDGGLTPTYRWSVAGAVVGTGATYSYAPVNGDEVKATFISSAACPAADSVSVATVVDVMPLLTPAVSIDVLANDTICQGSAATFFANITNGGDAPVYTWVVGGSIVVGVTGATYTFVPSNGQTVLCRLNSNYRCPAVNNVPSNTIAMHVDTLYVPILSISANPGTVAEAGEMVTFTASVAGGGPTPTYQWMVSGVVMPGATTSVFATDALRDGDSVTCVVRGSGECGMLTLNSVIMKITPASSVGTTSIANGDIRMMPNPTSGTFTVSGTLGTQLDEQLTIEITDVLGQVVYQAATTTRAGVLNERVQLSNALANGMYILNISNGSDRKVFHFVLKQ